MRRASGGFTLIELSIVLVIVGLLAGSVATGKYMIHAATVRAEISQLERYTTAVNTFRTKYDCFPGDCKSATTFFGATAPNGNTVYNGNGDNAINDANLTTDSGNYISRSEEYLNMFPQLAAARLVEGSFSNVAGTAYVNMPVDKIGRAAIVGTSLTALGTSGSNVTIPFNQWLLCYASNYSMSGGVYKFSGKSNVLTPAEAYQIDTKIDDGMPTTGRVQSADVTGPLYGGTTDNCLSNSSYNNNTRYNSSLLQTNTVSCATSVGWEGLAANTYKAWKSQGSGGGDDGGGDDGGGDDGHGGHDD